MSHDLNTVFYSHAYHPVQAGSIDGTDTAPHDNAVYRAMLASSTGLCKSLLCSVLFCSALTSPNPLSLLCSVLC